jgi:lysophospholipase L1-like esterase
VTILFSFVGFFVLVLFLVAIELASRWWIHHRGEYYVLPPGLRLRLQPDPDVFPQMEPVVRFDVNSDGERGDEAPRSPDGLYRILVAGGSQPEGYLLDQDSSWPGMLQRLLQRPEHLEKLRVEAVHVGNIARSGVGSEGLDLIFERVLPRYARLQAIIILVGASDVLRWLEAGAPLSAPPPFRTSELFRCHPELTFAWYAKRLALVELLRRWRQRRLRPVHVSERTCRWLGRARAMRASATDVRTIIPDPRAMLAHFERHFRSLLLRAKAHANRVIVVHQPWFGKPRSAEELALMWHGGVGQAWQEEVTTFYSHEVLSALMARLDARTTRIARELNVEQLDLMPIVEPGVETYYDFFHATPAGSRVIAAAVAATVLQPQVSVTGPATGSFAHKPVDSELRLKVS